jgi:hypothetical protein
MPSWILDHSSPAFAALAQRCMPCAWALLVLAVFGAASLFWPFVRGPEFRHRFAKPPEASGGRAFVGLLWLIALLIGSFAAGLRGLIPLVGDTVFIACAGTVCVEWYAWWRLPTWLGKIAELAVLALLWWLAWLIASAIPTEYMWPAFIISVSAIVLPLAILGLSGHWRRTVVGNLLGVAVICVFYIPRETWPMIPVWGIFAVIGILLAGAAPVLGAFWLRLPDTVANSVAPIWFGLVALLGWLGVPMIHE